MAEPTTASDPPEDDATRLPPRELPDRSFVDDWCAALVERVRPGGFAPAASSEPTTIAGRYQPLHRIGRGGIGEIWRAEHVGIGKEVALKFLRRELASDPLVRRRFLREGRLAAAVRHPGVVDITDVGETEDGRVYMVMELLEGRTIAEEVQWSGPLSWSRARELLVQLMEALACAHARGVVHRDLKPSNTMLVEREGGGAHCKIIDFGMARGRLGVEQSAELTRTGVILGSPAYMSPEQFRGEEADARSDVYSLGCLAYFMLAGVRPFAGDTAAELMYQHLMTPLPRLRLLDGSRGEQAAIQRWLDRASHKRPERRFQSMDAMLEGLEQIGRSRWSLAYTLAVGGGALVVAVGVGAMAVGVGGMDGASGPADRGVAPVRSGPEAGGPVAAAEAAPACGNGELDGGEGCDDGNDAPADGCEPDCTRTRILDVRAGKDFTCAVLSGGHLRCWGRQGPHLGQPLYPGHIGDDELPYVVPPVDFGPRRVERLGLEFYASHVCAVLDDDTARCWGDDHWGQLGLGPDRNSWGDARDEVPARLPPLELPPVRMITASEIGTCALAGSDPDALGIYCWGVNEHGQLGRGDTQARTWPPSVPVELGGAKVRDMAQGIVNTCAVLEGGAVRCWGGNRNLQLGTGWPRDRYVGDGVGDGRRGRLPDSADLDVEGLEGLEVAKVQVNGGWACVLGVHGEVRCWGGNDDGTLGLRHDQIPGCDQASNGVGCLAPRPTVAVDLGDLGKARIVDLQMGRRWACVLDDAGAVRCWGRASRGNLGYGERLRRVVKGAGIGHEETPAQAYAAMGHGGAVDVGDFDDDGEIDRVVKLALGYAHACVLVADGTLRCWGSNAEGQLGYGTTDDVGDDETPSEYYASHRCGAVPVFGGKGC